MVFANRGDKFSAPYRVQDLPYVRYTPLPPRVTSGAVNSTARRYQPAKLPAPKLKFRPWEETGPQSLHLDPVELMAPARAALKFRGVLTWVNLDGIVHAVCRDGEVVMSAEQQQQFNEGWDKI